MIDALGDNLLAFTLGDRFAHLTVSGMAPLRKTLPEYTRAFDREFYEWGLDCRMFELSDVKDFILPPGDQMATTVT
jgi:hypothetical protein